MAYVSWPSPYFTTPAFLTAFYDLSLHKLYHIPTCQQLHLYQHQPPWSASLAFCPPTFHHGMCSLVFLLYMHWTSCYTLLSLYLWLYPLPFTFSSLRFSSAIISVFKMCLALLPSLYMTAYCAVALSNHPMCPWSTILSLHTYCRPYRKRYWVFVSMIGLQIFILSCFQVLIVFIICIVVDGVPINWCNRALIGLLKRSVAGLGNPVPVGIYLICNKARLTSLLLSKQRA